MPEHKAPTNAAAQSRLTIVLHWLLALCVMYLFVSSWWMLALPLPSDEFTYRVLPFQLHKNVGITLFLIVLVMITIRLRDSRARHPQSPTLVRRLADFDHWVIYSLLLACCLSGYLSSSYSGWETSFWWLLNLQQWAAERDELNILYSDIHQWTCWLLLAILILHIGAALHHGFRDDGLLDSMFRL